MAGSRSREGGGDAGSPVVAGWASRPSVARRVIHPGWPATMLDEQDRRHSAGMALVQSGSPPDVPAANHRMAGVQRVSQTETRWGQSDPIRHVLPD